MSLGAFSRLQNAIKYCTRVRKRVQPANSAKNHKIYTDIHVDLFYNHIRHNVVDCFRLAFLEVRKTVENAASTAYGRILVAWHSVAAVHTKKWGAYNL